MLVSEQWSSCDTPITSHSFTWFTHDSCRISAGLYLKLNICDKTWTVNHISFFSFFFCKSDSVLANLNFSSCYFEKASNESSIPQASDTVTVGSQALVSKSLMQHLPSGPQALIQWASDRGHNPVTSYTSTPVANHFNIRLREPGKLKKNHILHSWWSIKLACNCKKL